MIFQYSALSTNLLGLLKVSYQTTIGLTSGMSAAHWQATFMMAHAGMIRPQCNSCWRLVCASGGISNYRSMQPQKDQLKTWHQSSVGLKDIPNPISSVARWQEIARRRSKEIAEGASTPKNRSRDGYLMMNIKHLTKTELGGGQLPIRKITAMHCEGKSLYDVDIQK